MALKISSTRMASLSRHALLASSQSIGHFDILRIACLFPPGSKRFCFRRRFTVLSMVQTTTPADAVPMTSSQGQSSSAVTSLLEKLRSRQARDAAFKSSPKLLQQPQLKEVAKAVEPLIVSFKELGLSDELMTAVHELKLLEPTEVQSLGIPAILKGESVVIASHTGSGKTLAYMLPLVQDTGVYVQRNSGKALRRDEADSGRTMKPNRPRAIVLCPTRELAEQVFQVAKSVCHHARFRPGHDKRRRSNEAPRGHA
ncbi:hypothetical protein O6H91_Y260000 [Diphasiastrum complanatum]|nr:hypothetical protein O6H91_Y260000 [Diphasiastrum complanatum]